jgi:hypothetical protein
MPQHYTLEQVKEWFGELTVLDTPRINQHLQSLGKYGDNPVKTQNNRNNTAWTFIFNECLGDVKNIHNNNDYIRYREEFQKRCGKTNDELNAMTKQYFVKLFAQVMKDIFTEEEKQRQEEKQQLQSYNMIQDAIEQASLQSYNYAIGSGARAGSKKKSNKRIKRKRRNKTRKYKKRN